MNASVMTTELEKRGPDASVLTLEEVERMSTDELLYTYKESGDERLKWPLVLRYEGLIKSAALQISGVYSSFAQIDDIVSEGIITLLGSIDKFDPSKGVKFETYVAKRIRGMVVDLARKQDWVPRNVRQRAKEIDQAVSTLSNELGRFPTDEETADLLGVSKERYQKDAASIALSNVLSLDALMSNTGREGAQFEVPSGDLYGQPEAVLQDHELQKILAKGIQSLRKNEQLVLSLYYEKNLHMKEIAQVMDLSAPRISQIHARAIQKLRLYMDIHLNGALAPNQAAKGKKG